MSGILAVLQRDGAPVETTAIEAMLASGSRRAVDGQSMWVQGPVALAHQHFWVTPEEQGESQPLSDEQGRCTITADVRLDNRTELIETLGLDTALGRTLSDARLILCAYRRWGTDCVVHLLGDLAFAIWDAAEQALFLARDALGCRSLVYYQDSRVALAASDVSHLLAHPAVSPAIDELRLADYLENRWQDQERTFHRGILYCPPAHCLRITADEVRLWRYWELDPESRTRYARDDDYAAAYLELLTQSVRARLRTTGKVGISLSGGADSTALAALAARQLAPTARLHSFTCSFDKLRHCDERRYIQPVLDQYGIDATFVPCDDAWTLSDPDRWPVERDLVLSDAYAWMPARIRQAAHQAGIRVLLSGLEGDLLYEGARFWGADMLREWRFRDLVTTLRRAPHRTDAAEQLLSDGLRHLIPAAMRRAYRRTHPRPNAPSNPGLAPQFVACTGLLDRLAEQPAGLDSRRPDWWQRYRTLNNSSVALGSAMSAAHSRLGLELSAPYLDRRLVTFVMSLPADQLGRPGRTRWVLRNAMMGLLPEAVRERQSKTGFYPLFRIGLRERQVDTVRSLVADAEIVRRGYVRPEWLLSEIDPTRVWTADGFWLWLCICLELWLRVYW